MFSDEGLGEALEPNSGESWGAICLNAGGRGHSRYSCAANANDKRVTGSGGYPCTVSVELELSVTEVAGKNGPSG